MSPRISPIFNTDFYKTGHRTQYPKGTTEVYSNLTARSARPTTWPRDGVVVWWIQAFLQRLKYDFEDHFFDLGGVVIEEYKKRMDSSLGPDAVKMDHLYRLLELGYLPLHIKALPEGTIAPFKTPILTIRNTHPDFFWLPNFLETMLSAELWHPMTCATIAWEYRKLLQAFADETSDDPGFVEWQGHDFSMRGHTSVESAGNSGTGHLLSFMGTDTIPALENLECYYGAKGMIGGSVPATEHSVMCMGGKETELETFRRLITEVVPKGIVSIVSDTWDLWKVATEVLPALRETILARDGKVVIRPDSGDPADILCGFSGISLLSGYPDKKGLIELLWETFGGTTNSKGFKVLNPKIGAIYGDRITYETAREICDRLEQKGFASTNVVFGIGSFTYQYVTRDTLGFAMKATSGVIDGRRVSIEKNPVTDDGVKKSHKGLLRVNSDLSVTQDCSEEEEAGGMLRTVFLNGQLQNQEDFATIRARLLSNLR